MNKEQEKKYGTLIFILTIFLMVVSVAGFIYTCYWFFHGENINNNIFEMIFYVGHILILVFAIYFANNSRKKGLMAIKNLMYVNQYGVKSKPAFVIAWVLTGFFFLVFGYFIVALFNINVPRLNFPILLLVSLVVVSLTVWTIGLFFGLHPIIDKKLRNKQNDKDNHK